SGAVGEENLEGSASLQVKDQSVYLFANNSGPLQAYAVPDGKHTGHFLSIPEHLLKANFSYQDGSQRLQEFYYGSSYLSHTGRNLRLNGNETQIILYDFEGKEEIINP